MIELFIINTGNGPYKGHLIRLVFLQLALKEEVLNGDALINFSKHLIFFPGRNEVLESSAVQSYCIFFDHVHIQYYSNCMCSVVSFWLRTVFVVIDTFIFTIAERLL